MYKRVAVGFNMAIVFTLLKGNIYMQKIPLTKGGYDALQKELKTLRDVDRPTVIAAIADAREHGDLSENAEYHAAREKQSFIEGRITELESILSLADVIDPLEIASDKITFGATVIIADCDTDAEKTYTIVGNPEANLAEGKISLSSPVAQALIGKEEGDTIQVQAPGGTTEYEIVEILYK